MTQLFLLMLALTAGAMTLQAQRSTLSIYTMGTVVTRLDSPKKMVYKKGTYYYANGVWYKVRGRKFVTVRAPLGIAVRKLPRGNKVVVINGRKLYKYKGVWYRKSGRKYVVVNV